MNASLRFVTGFQTHVAQSLVAAYFAATALAYSQTSVVSSFQNGTLTWSNPTSSATMFTVEWSPHSLGPWHNDWNDLSTIITGSTTVSADVPMFYRVAHGFNDLAMKGVWIVDTGEMKTYLKADGDGLVTEIGAFMMPDPVGWYDVYPDGSFHMVLYERTQLNVVDGRMLNPDMWEYVYEDETNTILRVEDEGALAGTWTGTIGPYTNVLISVGARGFAPVVWNIIDFACGSMFVDISNNVGGLIYTGGKETNPWNRVQISGIRLNITNIVGDYENDSDAGVVLGGVSLQRQ